MTTAFENLSIQNSAPAVTNFPSTWNTNVAQPAAVPVDTVSQQQNAIQLPGTVVPSANTWNSAVSSTAAPAQETQQPNSATISYPTYPATNQGQTNESQNVGVYPQQPQQQPIEYVQSHAAAHQIPYVSQPAVYSYTQAETAQYNGTGYQVASTNKYYRRSNFIVLYLAGCCCATQRVPVLHHGDGNKHGR